jgi:hypothetical protein
LQKEYCSTILFNDLFQRGLTMLRLAVVAAITSVLSISQAAMAADPPDKPPPSPAANVAPPISSIATFEGEYFCIFHDRVYSVGAEICAGPKSGLSCQEGALMASPPKAAKWIKSENVDFCKDTPPPPVPQ